MDLKVASGFGLGLIGLYCMEVVSGKLAAITTVFLPTLIIVVANVFLIVFLVRLMGIDRKRSVSIKKQRIGYPFRWDSRKTVRESLIFRTPKSRGAGYHAAQNCKAANQGNFVQKTELETHLL